MINLKNHYDDQSPILQIYLLQSQNSIRKGEKIKNFRFFIHRTVYFKYSRLIVCCTS